MADRENERTPVAPVDPTAPLGATLGLGRPLGSTSTPSRGTRHLWTFNAGDLVGGRYRVVRPLGEGGMGEVYEAEDLLLKERLALKTVRPDVASDERVIQRFKREIQLARRVTHPNVCRIFDVGLHRPGGDRAVVAFLTMELLEGETLSQRLARAGRLSPAEATPLLAQLGGALDAAHDAGVIHRDFKSANVILTRDESGAPRAVITDFGLARSICREAADPNVTGDGGVVGSPSYMAPEQVEGKDVTFAADLYALGVVTYEMMTGRLPFVSDSPLSTAVMRLREDAVPPCSHVPELPVAWERMILHCLAREPGRRPTSARAALDELAVAPGPRPRGRAWLGAVAVVAAAAAVFGIYLAVRSRAPVAVLAPPLTPTPALIVSVEKGGESGRRSVAVMSFRNLTGQASDGWIDDALGEMLSTELGASDQILVIPGESVARARRELALGDEVSYAPDTLAKLRTVLGADYVLTGSYITPGDSGKLRLDVRLLDTRTGETVAALSQTGTEEDLVELVADTGKSLRGRLSVGEPSAQELAGVHALQPKPDVARLYAEGLAHLRVAACSAARGPLEQAVAVDPTYALARSALAEALACLGHDDRAVEEARKAVEQAADLPEQVRLATEGRLNLASRQPEKALEIYRTLFERFPDNFDYGLQLAHLELRFMRDADLTHTLDALRKLPPPMGTSPRIDLVEAMRQVMGGHPREGLALAVAARGRAERDGMRLVAADALMVETHVHAEADEHDDALAAISKARAIYEAAGDLDGIAAALSIEAYVRQGAGDEKGVKKAEDQVNGIAEDLDNPREILRFKRLLGIRLAGLGDLRGALKAIAAALEIARGRKDTEATATIATYAAYLFMENGDVRGAASLVSDALASDLSPALRATLLQTIATLDAIDDDFAAAHERLDEARRSGSPGSDAAIEAAHAAVLVLEERYQEAEKVARAALPTAGAFKPLLRFGLGTALVGQHRYKEALVVLRDLEGSPVFKPFPQSLGLAVVRAQARVGAGGSDAAGGRAELQAAIARARGGSFRYTELDARYRLGGVLVESGDQSGRAVLAEVARDADKLGYRLLARRARGKAAG